MFIDLPQLSVGSVRSMQYIGCSTARRLSEVLLLTGKYHTLEPLREEHDFSNLATNCT